MNHKQIWALMAAYYRLSLNDTTIAMYANDTAEIDVNDLKTLFDEYKRNPNNKTLPMPSWFLEKKNPIFKDPKLISKEVSSRISSAISKFGWCNEEKAAEYIGNVGWKIVSRYGGWKKVCESVGVNIDPGIFLAQTRDLAETLIHDHSNNVFDKPVNFIESKNQGLTKLIE